MDTMIIASLHGCTEFWHKKAHFLTFVFLLSVIAVFANISL